jgi:hypothetical protein
MNKQDVYDFLNNTSIYLKNNLQPQKEKIVMKVKEAVPKGGEPEGYFIKNFLAHLLSEFFKQKSEGLIIEGINSKGQTQFKNYFFNSRPAPDFRFKKSLPFNLVGEFKYCKLQLRSIAIGVGQLMTYIESSKIESEPSQYGYLIFFNTGVSKELSTQENNFIRLLWEQENIFITII